MMFGDILRTERKKQGLTQIELAARANIGITSLRRYEANQRQPNLKICKKLCDALGVDFSLYSHEMVHLEFHRQNNVKLPQSEDECVERYAAQHGTFADYMGELGYCISSSVVEIDLSSKLPEPSTMAGNQKAIDTLQILKKFANTGSGVTVIYKIVDENKKVYFLDEHQYNNLKDLVDTTIHNFICSQGKTGVNSEQEIIEHFSRQTAERFIQMIQDPDTEISTWMQSDTDD